MSYPGYLTELDRRAIELAVREIGRIPVLDDRVPLADEEELEAEMLREFLYDDGEDFRQIIVGGERVWIDVRAMEDQVVMYAAAQKALDDAAEAAGMPDGLRLKHQELLLEDVDSSG